MSSHVKAEVLISPASPHQAHFIHSGAGMMF